MQQNIKKLKKILLIFILLLIFSNIKVYANSSLTNNPEKISTQNLTETNTTENLKKEIENLNITKFPYTTFTYDIQNKNIEKVFMNDEENIIFYLEKSGQYYSTDNPSYELFKKELLEQGIEVKDFYDILEEDYFKVLKESTIETNNEAKNSPTTFSINFGTICLMSMFFMPLLLKRFAIRPTPMPELESSNINEAKPKKEKDSQEKQVTSKTFEDVAGLKEVKEDVKTLVDFIVNNEEYEKMGAKLPKGVILYGPPGTGKTLLAKAIAGEANVPFFSASGSDFIEMYVGVGPKRIRELFSKARKNAPCILFIDEIDAICSRRSNSQNSEDRKTINALLTEMDGFNSSDNVLVIGATNRLEDLDPAILRPGRFTNKYCVPLPETMEDRFTIINLYAKNKKFTEDVSLKTLAKETIGCSPAEIESILNEAAIIATKNKLSAINNDCIEEAFNKNILRGHIKKDNKSKREEELKLIAYHEAGHALVGLLFGEEISKVTILSTTSGAGGVTFTIPKKVGLYSRNELKQKVLQLYGGRCAEYILYGDMNKTTTGASNDIEKATEILYQMVSVYGMNEDYGMLNLHSLKVLNKQIVEEASKLSKELEEECKKLLKEHKEDLEKIANLLLEKETIHYEDLKFVKQIA